MSDRFEPGAVIKSGVREPMDMKWLSFGMNDDKNAVAIKAKNKCLVFTMNIFCYTIVILHRKPTLFMDDERFLNESV